MDPPEKKRKIKNNEKSIIAPRGPVDLSNRLRGETIEFRLNAARVRVIYERYNFLFFF